MEFLIVPLILWLLQGDEQTSDRSSPTKTPSMIEEQNFSRPSISIADASLGGVALGMSFEAVVENLGEPLKSGSEGDAFDQFVFPDMWVSFDSDVNGALYVVGYGTTSGHFCLPLNVCPGHSAERVMSVFGQTSITPARSDKGERVEYDVDDYCWVELFLDDGLVSEIRLACLP